MMSVALVWQAQIIASQREAIQWLKASSSAASPARPVDSRDLPRPAPATENNWRCVSRATAR